MRYGAFLQNHGTIGFVAPSFGCNIDPYKTAFENAQRRWKRQGYRLDLGPNCYAGCGVGISNTPKACGEELTEYYLSKDNDCLIACGGGELMCEILDYVDWEQIAQSPAKWYMGFSDNTNMTYLLTTLCDTASIYGPCAPSFGMNPQHKAIKDAFGILTGGGVSTAPLTRSVSNSGASCPQPEGGGVSTPPLTRSVSNSGASCPPPEGGGVSTPPLTFTIKGYPKWEIEGIKDEENPLAPYHLTERKILKFYDGAAIARDENSIAPTQPGVKGAISQPGTAATAPLKHNILDCETILSGKEIPETNFEGRLLGGCMDCLVNLLGTRYDRTVEFIEKYKGDGIIWFLEACDLNVFGIRRAMWQMEHAGWFRYVKGFLIGRPFSGLDPMMNLDRYQAVLDVAGRKGVPVIMDADLGHLPPSMPLITGSYAQVHIQGNDLEVAMELRP